MQNTILFFFILYFNLMFAQIADFKNINFTKADNTAKLNKKESLKNLPLLCYKLTHNLNTDVEKFRAIYTWVSTNIKGDSKMHNKVTKMREKFKKDSISLYYWNKEYKKYVFKNLIKHKKTMCTGYAYLIKEMAIIIGIDCKIIDGYGRTVSSNLETLETPNHSWNAVKLNNKWYLCDATWSSGYMNENDYFIKDYNDGYFLTDPILFSKNHFPVNKKWLLNSPQTSIYFTETPIVYGEIFKHKIVPVLPFKMQINTIKHKAIRFELKNLNGISSNKISLVHFTGSHENILKIYDIKNEGDIISFKSKFKWKGQYDVHLKIDTDIVATYTIKVKR